MLQSWEILDASETEERTDVDVVYDNHTILAQLGYKPEMSSRALVRNTEIVIYMSPVCIVKLISVLISL